MYSSRPRYGWLLFTTFITAMVGSVAGPGAWAADTGTAAPAEEARPINIDVKDAPIAEVLRMLGKAAGVNILLGSGVTGTVEAISLRDVTVETALALIAEAQNLYYFKKDNVYVVSKEPPKGNQGVIPAATATAPATQSPATAAVSPVGPISPVTGVPAPQIQPGIAAPAASSNSFIPAPPMPKAPQGTVVVPNGQGGKRTTALVPLRYASAQSISNMFGGGVANSAGATPANPRRAYGARGGSNVTQDIFGGYAAPSAGSSAWGQLDSGLGGGTGGRSNRGGRNRGGNTGNNSNTGNTGGLGGGRSNTSGTGGGTSGGQIQLPEGIDEGDVIAYMPQNALLVRGTQEGIDELREIITLLDQPTKQVEIATRFIEVQTGAENALGIDWSVSNGSLEFFNTGFIPGNAVNNVVRFARGRFEGELRALISSNRATVVNEPRVVTQNNLYAEINFSTEIPYFTAQISYNNFGQRTVDFTNDFVDVENYLGVTPRINGDDSITMDLQPELDDTIGTVQGPNGESIPIVTTQTILTQVTVADGETLVIGGLVRKNETLNIKETPLLSKIPIIGSLFRSNQKSSTNSELLIFVTPRIVRDVPAQ